jgi:nucleoside-diphosphate-sugar epimerase
MRIAIVGATGNAGTSLLRAIEGDDEVESVVGIARRRPRLELPKVEWAEADVTRSDLVPLLRGADAVVHLAWLIQPSRDESTTAAVNVAGSSRVFRATAEAGVPKLVYASSVGAYSPGPKDRLVDESHPTDGIHTSFYSRHKAAVERALDRFESEHPEIDVVRSRPALMFKGEAAAGIRRLFAGPLLPNPLLRPGLIGVIPDVPGLRFQAVHSLDAADAHLRAAKAPVRGAFNLAAEPVLDPAELAQVLGARPVRVPARVLRRAVELSWKLRLQPTSPGWLDLALRVPLMDSARAQAELGWRPRRSSSEALLELIEGMRRSSGLPTPPLDPRSGGPLRYRELVTGVGARP